jgi:hypothetical protein
MDLAIGHTSTFVGLAILIALAVTCFILPAAPDDDQGEHDGVDVGGEGH